MTSKDSVICGRCGHSQEFHTARGCSKYGCNCSHGVEAIANRRLNEVGS